MIKISKKYLNKIILEESKRALGEVAFFDDEGKVDYEMRPSNDDSSDLEVEQIADIAMTALMTAVAESKDLPTSMSDPNGTMTAVELELEDELLDSFLDMSRKVMETVATEEQKARERAEIELREKKNLNKPG